MSKKYTASDYEKLAKEYAKKAKAAHTAEMVRLGELFVRLTGIDSLQEAEHFLTEAQKLIEADKRGEIMWLDLPTVPEPVEP